MKVQISDIIETIDDIKPSAAYNGPDEIVVLLLKNCIEALATPIFIIWSNSLSTRSVPCFHKFSHLFPFDHNEDSRAPPANYRPISLTSHIIKIYERIIRKKLVSFGINSFISDKS